MKKRFLAGLMVATMVSTMLFIPGCNSSSSKKGTEITWYFWDDPKTSKDAMTKGYKEVIDRFNKKFEGKYSCKVEIAQLDGGLYYSKLNSQADAGKAPELYMCDPGPRIQEQIDKGTAADMSAVLDANEDWKKTFNEDFFAKLKDKDGKIRAIPTNYASSCVYYNKEIFKEAGIAEPPKTFDELISACEKIKSAGKDPIGVACGANSEWCLGMIAGYLCDREGGPTNLDGIKSGSVKWTDKTYKDAGEKLTKLAKYFQKTAKSDANDPVTEGFATGKTAMLVQGTWAIGQINGKHADFAGKYDLFKFPAIDGSQANANRVVCKTDNICMSAKAEGDKKDAAIELLKMFTDQEEQTYTVQKAGKMPVTNYDIDYSSAPEQLQTLKKMVEEAKGDTLGFYNEEIPDSEVGAEFNKTYVSIALGDKKVDEALEALNKFSQGKIWK